MTQAFNRVQLNIEEFNALNAANRDANVQAVAITAAFFALNRFSEYASHCGVLAYGYLAVTGAATVGTVIACSMSSSFSDQSNLKPVLYTGTVGSPV